MASPSSEGYSSGNLYPDLSSSPDSVFENLLEPPTKIVEYQERNLSLKEVKKILNENKDNKTKDIEFALDGNPHNSFHLEHNKFSRDHMLLVECVESEDVAGRERDKVRFPASDTPAYNQEHDRTKKYSKSSLASARDIKLELGESNKMGPLLIHKSIKTRGLLSNRPTLHSRTGFRRYINIERNNGMLRKNLNTVKTFIKNVIYFCDISKYALKKIESNFGSSVTSYFVLLKHLILMNFFIILVQGLLVIAPQLTEENPDNYSLASSRQTISICMNNTGMSEFVCVISEFIVPIFTGEGWFTNTPLFIGHYSFAHINPITNSTTYGYHMPSAFLYTYFAVLLLVTVLLAQWVGDSVLLAFTGLKQEPGLIFAAIIFSSWDYNITKQKSARRSLKANLINLTELHHEYTEERDTRSWSFLFMIYLWRVVTWLVTLLLLLAGCFLILISPLCNVLNIINEQCELTTSFRTILTPVVVLIVQAVLDFIFPILTKLEFYHRHSLEVFVSLTRIVLVRVFSILAISIELLSTYIQSKENRCWETEYGQELYRQTVFALISSIFVYGVYLALRRLISSIILREIHTWNWIPKKGIKALDFLIDGPSFNIPTRVMNIIYIQALVWLGMFFCPWLGFLGFLGFLLLFIVMLGTTLAFIKFDVSNVNFSAKSFLFYNFILIAMFGFTNLLLVWPLFSFTPSTGCSPFRGHLTIYTLFTDQLSILASNSSVTILGNNFPDPNPVQWLPADLINSPLVLPVFSILLVIIVGLARTISRKNKEIDHLNKRVFEETIDKTYFLSVAKKMGDKYFMKLD